MLNAICSTRLFKNNIQPIHFSIMKTDVTTTKGKIQKKSLWITKVLSKWGSNYINAMSKALYPTETKEGKSKNDIHRIFYK